MVHKVKNSLFQFKQELYSTFECEHHCR